MYFRDIEHFLSDPSAVVVLRHAHHLPDHPGLRQPPHQRVLLKTIYLLNPMVHFIRGLPGDLLPPTLALAPDTFVFMCDIGGGLA